LNVVDGKPIVNQKISQFLLTELSDDFLSIPSPIPHLTLELKILELIDRSKNKNSIQKQPKTTQVKKNPNLENLKSDNIQMVENDMIIAISNETDSIAVANFSTQNNDIINSISNARAKDAFSTLELNGDGNKLCEEWHNFVDLVAKDNSTIASLLRSAKPISGSIGEATIGVFYKFHQEQLMQPKFNALIQEFIKNIADGYLKINFILTKTPEKAELVEVDNNESLAQVVSQALM
ncbi:hypothetical protein KA089_01625, partial [Candidatus Woesebacteria bacterium]|nr:hypothetical protein [Candidatus Woesebacteria bacterium]